MCEPGSRWRTRVVTPIWLVGWRTCSFSTPRPSEATIGFALYSLVPLTVVEKDNGAGHNGPNN